MKTFIEEILADIDWRIAELATLKSLPIKYSFQPDHRELHIKYSIPAIYAIWEGFIKNVFHIYSTHLNTLSLKRSDIAYPLLTHHFDSVCNFGQARKSFVSKEKLVNVIINAVEEDIIFSPKLPTESNVNLKVLNRIMERFCVQKIDQKYEKDLDKLLLFRNKIAHGENALKVTLTQMTAFIKIIEDIMLDVILALEKSEALKSYMK